MSEPCSYAALARYYDAFTKNMDYKKRTDYICTLLVRSGLKPNATLLDLACGTGSFTLALARRGYDMVGVDASADMLTVAALRSGPAPMFICQHLEDLDLYGTAQGAVCLTDSVNHLTQPARVRKFFRRLALFLEPGAPFVFDVNTLHKHERVLGDNTFIYEADGALCVWQNRWDADAWTTQIDLDLFIENEDGSYTRQQESFSERAYTIEELTAWLGKAGFAVEHVYGELTQEPPREGEERVYFVCRRK